MPQPRDDNGLLGVGGFVRGVLGLLDLAAHLQENEEGVLVKEKIWQSSRGRLSASRSFSVRLGVLPEDIPADGFWHERQRLKPSGRDISQEPLTDFFAGPRDVTILCELPDVAADRIEISVDGERVTIKAGNGSCSYIKTICLPCAVEAGTLTSSYQNGLLEICLAKTGRATGGGLDNA